MPLEKEESESDLVVRIEGSLNFVGAEDLKELLTQYFESGGRTAVLDLTAVPHMDSTAIGVIVSAHTRAADSGGSMRLAAPQDMVLKLLKAAHLDTYIPIYSSLEEARR